MTTPVIIEAALNGTTTKDRNPNVPRSPEEIAADAGAAIVHNHVDVVMVPGDESAARERTPTNVALDEEAVELCAAAGRPVATIAEAESILDLPRRAA